jgi:hypothetical protein
MPKLEADLSVALSSVIARNFIEQTFVQPPAGAKR